MPILPHLDAHLIKWQLALDGEPFETRSSWLAQVRRGDTPALLKVYKPGSDETRSATILNHWGGSAVRVLDGDETAIVIERIAPGTPLCDLVASDDDGATHIWCDVVEKLHVRPAPAGFRDLRRCGHALLDKPCPDHTLLPPDLFECARVEFAELAANQSGPLWLLHADLHHANILKDERRGWLVIDPKGYAGELAFEAASFLHNPTHEYSAAPQLERRIRIISSRLNLDGERLLRWVFAHGVLAAVWSARERVWDPIGGIGAANAALEVLGRKVGSAGELTKSS